MDVEVTKEDQLAIVRVRGFLDTKSSADFERHVLALLHGGSKAFAMDFTKLDMITSAGIRILMMAVKRLGGADRVALWGLNEQVKVVFQIAGLAGVFQAFDSQQAAVDHLKKPGAAPADGVQASKMTRLITRLLVDSDGAPARRVGGNVSKMAEEVSELLKSPKS
jgi:anti-sigma B factor antagonist